MTCVYCRQTINDKAKICHWCNSETKSSKENKEKEESSNNGCGGVGCFIVIIGMFWIYDKINGLYNDLKASLSDNAVNIAYYLLVSSYVGLGVITLYFIDKKMLGYQKILVCFMWPVVWVCWLCFMLYEIIVKIYKWLFIDNS